mmetsp:Transcript_15913/g.54291  ORF Transcript_15913/g.54291 Transcript_15913/m.54291 type:complete len:215 (-) Transcript_15913:194-838(-)
MLSFMSTPPRSFTPARRSADAAPRPIFGHDAWMFPMAPSSMMRETACTSTVSRNDGPPRSTRPPSLGLAPFAVAALNIGAFAAMNGSGTNSVNPPVSSWIRRSNSRCAAISKGVSTWPYINVEVVLNPRPCAVETTSTHSFAERRPLASMSRTPSSRISADVPGKESTPASRSIRSTSRIEARLWRAPCTTSSGENAWRCTSGTAALTAAAREA